MLEHMYACDDKLKVPRLLPPGTKVAHKTGSVNASRTDAGIIEYAERADRVLHPHEQEQGPALDRRQRGRPVLRGDRRGHLSSISIRRARRRSRRSRRSWRSGASGELVVALQRTLNARIKPSPGIGDDGDFGPETEDAVKTFQKQEKLEGRPAS